jgi:hypothetical protein
MAINDNNFEHLNMLPKQEPGFVDFALEKNHQEIHLQLARVPFPNGLRADNQAATFIDNEFHLFLKPLGANDYNAYTTLKNAHLTKGQVVYNAETHDPELITYGDADLVSLSAIFNASVTVPDAHEDMVDSLVKISNYIQKMYDSCGFVPVDVAVGGWAIDRETGDVELLPPFWPTTHSKPDEKYSELVVDLWENAQKYQSYDQQQEIERVLQDAHVKINEGK